MLDIIILLSVIVFLALLYLVEKYKFDKKEKDLLNRLMAKNLGEYVSATNSIEKKIKPITLSDLMEKQQDKDILPVD